MPNFVIVNGTAAERLLQTIVEALGGNIESQQTQTQVQEPGFMSDEDECAGCEDCEGCDESDEDDVAFGSIIETSVENDMTFVTYHLPYAESIKLTVQGNELVMTFVGLDGAVVTDKAMPEEGEVIDFGAVDASYDGTDLRVAIPVIKQPKDGTNLFIDGFDGDLGNEYDEDDTQEEEVYCDCPSCEKDREQGIY